MLTTFFFSHLAKAHLWPIFNTVLGEMSYVFSLYFQSIFLSKINAIIHATVLVKEFIHLSDGNLGLGRALGENMYK